MEEDGDYDDNHDHDLVHDGIIAAHPRQSPGHDHDHDRHDEDDDNDNYDGVHDDYEHDVDYWC